MARTIYSTRFVAKTLRTADGLSASYVVPAGKVAIIRNVTFDVIIGPCTVQLLVSPLPGPLSVRLVRWVSQPLDAIVTWEGRVPLTAGESVTVTNVTGGTSSAAVFVSGWLLTA